MLGELCAKDAAFQAKALEILREALREKGRLDR
jgi:hypothetical protein